MKYIPWIVVALIVTGCGFSENPQGTGNDSPRLGESFVPAEPEATRYVPLMIHGETLVEIGITLHVSSISVSKNQTIKFVNPPEQASGISWTIEYDPEYLLSKDDQILNQYPSGGWKFKAIKTGDTQISLRNKNQYFTSCERDFCPEQDNYVLTYNIVINEK